LSSFKIGVLSDTHKKSELQVDAIELLKSQNANYLLHLGDFEIEKNLEILHNANLPYRAVLGNNDSSLRGLQNRYNIAIEPYYLEIRDLRIKMMHLPYYLTPDSDIVLFGHLHQFSVEYNNRTLFLNPGEVCARNKELSECALIEVNNNSYRIEYFFKKPYSKSYNNKLFNFRRD